MYTAIIRLKFLKIGSLKPSECYHAELEKNSWQADAAQLGAVQHLDRLYAQLTTPRVEPEGLFAKLKAQFVQAEIEPIKGLYFWGGVGRGKTWLMDLFYESLPLENKKRVHFHRYMQSVHQHLKRLHDQQDPLAVVAQGFAAEYRVLCFDEFFVSDIGDAMLLAGLLKALFARGVVLVTTSNTQPDNLYKNGLQRARFLPAIELIKQHTDVVNLDAGNDYRLRTLGKGDTYYVPADEAADAKLLARFKQLATGKQEMHAEIDVLGRIIFTRAEADGVVWFEFDDICDGPRSNADYIELARLYHTVMLSGVPIFTDQNNDPARRFIELVDEFYDSNVNLILSAQSQPHELYQGHRLADVFQRTNSRLIEMQSSEYLSGGQKA